MQDAEEEEDRVCWSGGPLHQINLASTATKWEKVCSSLKQPPSQNQANNKKTKAKICLFLPGFQEGGRHEIQPCEQQVKGFSVILFGTCLPQKKLL